MESKDQRLHASRHNTELTYRVFSVMRHKKECGIDEVVEGCSSYKWEQVLLEVIRLSRTGELRLIYKQGGDYAIRLPAVQ